MHKIDLIESLICQDLISNILSITKKQGLYNAGNERIIKILTSP